MTFGVKVRWQGQEHKSRAVNGVRLRVGPIAGPVTSVGNGSTATRGGQGAGQHGCSPYRGALVTYCCATNHPKT